MPTFVLVSVLAVSSSAIGAPLATATVTVAVSVAIPSVMV